MGGQLDWIGALVVQSRHSIAHRSRQRPGQPAAATHKQSPDSPNPTPSPPRLRQLGYQPALTRDFRLLTSLAISFTIVSVLTGLTGLYGLGYQYGGPAAIVWSWPVCVAFTMCIAAGLAELCSAYPLAGGCRVVVGSAGGGVVGVCMSGRQLFLGGAPLELAARAMRRQSSSLSAQHAPPSTLNRNPSEKRRRLPLELHGGAPLVPRPGLLADALVQPDRPGEGRGHARLVWCGGVQWWPSSVNGLNRLHTCKPPC